MSGPKDLEALVFKTMTMNESAYVRAEMVLESIQNVTTFYEKCGFKKNGPLLGELQPMIKEIKPDVTSKKTLQRTSRGAKTPTLPWSLRS